MKTFVLLTSALALFAPALRASSPTDKPRVYLQAAGVLVAPRFECKSIPGEPRDFSGGDIDSAFGGAFAVGMSLAPHTIELEVSAYSSETTGLVPDYRYTDNAEFKFQNYLLNYRYTFPIAGDQRHRFFVGASAGVMKLSYDRVLRFDFERWFYPEHVTVHEVYSSSGSDQALMGGMLLGAEYEFVPHASLILSARLLFAQETEVTSSGLLPILHVGFGFRF